MQPVVMRPTFDIQLPMPASEAMDRVRRELKAQAEHGPTISAGSCAEFLVDTRQRRLWSPHLSVQARDSGVGCSLHGRFSPRPEIWTLLMFLYFTVISLTFFGAMLGCAQWMLNWRPWGLMAIPAGLLIVTFLHVTSLIGQRLSADQMEQLRSRLDDVLQVAFGDDYAGRSGASSVETEGRSAGPEPT